MNVWGQGGVSGDVDFPLEGNLLFNGLARRIRGDLSNATLANRLMFQTSTVNGSSSLGILPNGTGAVSGVYAFGGSDPANATTLGLAAQNVGPCYFECGRTGTGTYRDLTFLVGGNERMRIDASGRIGVGVTPSAWSSAWPVVDVLGASLYSTGYVTTGITTNLYNNGTDWKYKATAEGVLYVQGSGTHQFYTVPSGTGGATATLTERMHIRNDGNIGIANVGNPDVRLHLYGIGTSNSTYSFYTRNAATTLTFCVRDDGLVCTGTAALSPYNLTTGSAANVFVDLAGVLYRSTSSLRYKTDIVDYNKGGDVVDALRPVSFRSTNGDPRTFAGFIAEEFDALGLTEFVEYRADDGEPDAVHYSNITALLTKALQETRSDLRAAITRITALEEA